MLKLLEFFDRSVYFLSGTSPAVFYLADRDGGGILINTPAYSAVLAQQLNAVAPLKFAFFPSRLGAQDVDRWRTETGLRTLAYGHEARGISGEIDTVLDRENKFSRTIDFLPMSGRTESSCALRCKNQPGIIFFGPILARGDSGWPTLAPNVDDYSYENRLFGVLGLQDLKYQYAFTDDFDPALSRSGPGADAAIQREIAAVLES